MSNRPSGSTDWRFTELFDIAEIQSLQDSFARTHRVASVIIDPDGEPITRPSNTPQDLEEFWDRGASIRVGERHLARWLVGPGANGRARGAAAARIMSSDRFDEVCRFLDLMADTISRQAVANAELRRILAAKERAERERDDLEEHLRLSAGLEAVGRLAGGIAHDFGNLLCAIQGYAEVLADQLSEPVDPGEPALRILAASERAGDLVTRLLDFSRHRPGRRDILHVGDLVAETMALLERTLPANIELEQESHGQVAPILGDSSCLESALLNLGINAGHAMPEGGRLTFAVRDRRFPAASKTNGGRSGRYVEIQVRDTGVGMDEETRRHIFEPFFTTRGDDGTGLGLTRVYGSVKAHSGHIEVESAPERGTVVTILLPALTASAASRPGLRAG